MIVQLYHDARGETRYRKRGDNAEIFGDGYDSVSSAKRGLADEVSDTLLTFGSALIVEGDGSVGVDREEVDRIVNELLADA